MIYAFIIINIIILYPLLHIKKFDNALAYNKPVFSGHNKIYFYINAFFLIFVIAMRDLSIGIDTWNYYNVFYGIKDTQLGTLFKIYQAERGYVLYQYILGKFGGEFRTLLILEAALFIGVISVVIYKYSDIPWLSFYLFVTFGFFTFSMSTIRQTIALSFTLISFLYIKKKKFFWYLLFIGLALTFHLSAAIFLPAYWLDKLKLNKRNIVLAALVLAITYIFRDIIFAFINNYVRIEYEYMRTGGIMWGIFLILSLIIALNFKKNILKNDKNNVFFYYMMIMAIILLPICKVNPVLFRLAFYYSIFIIIFIPNMLFAIKDKYLKILGILAYLITGLYYFLSGIITPVSQLLPYRFY